MVDEKIKCQDRIFWAYFDGVFRSAYPGQPVPKRRGLGFAQAGLIPGAAWITLFRATTGERIGVFLRCKGPTGLAFFGQLSKRKAAVNAELRRLMPGCHPYWGQSPSGSERDIALGTAAPMSWNEAADQRHAEWLSAAYNALYADAGEAPAGRS